MQIYRIEHGEHGAGICQITGSPFCFIYRLYAFIAGEPPELEHDRFPCSAEQCKAFEATALGTDESTRQHMRYAFPSLAALAKWFPSPTGRKAMQAQGAELWTYEVPELVANGPNQIVFDKRLAAKLHQLDLGSLKAL